MNDYKSIPLVSVCCITYNHERFIKNAIEGFLIQKTDFPFEIIIHDDASTDDTSNIVRSYAKKYPELIKPIFQTENQYSQGIKVWVKYAIPKCQGKYIAFCEGDDYWIDPLKLQKQAEYLEKNPQCALVHTNCYVKNNHRNTTVIRHKNELIKSVGSREIILSNKINTCTTMFRKELLQGIEDMPNELKSDRWLWLVLSTKGTLDYIHDLTAVYNIHEGGIYSGIRYYKRVEKRLFSSVSALKIFPAYTKEFNTLIISEGFKGLVGSIKHFDVKSGIYFIRLLFNWKHWKCEFKMLLQKNRSGLWFSK